MFTTTDRTLIYRPARGSIFSLCASPSQKIESLFLDYLVQAHRSPWTRAGLRTRSFRQFSFLHRSSRAPQANTFCRQSLKSGNVLKNSLPTVTFSERQHVCNNTRCFSGLHTLLNIWSKSERANDEFIVLSSKPINIYFSLFSYRSVQRVSVFSSAFRNTQRIMCTALTRRLCDELKIPCYSSPEACSNQTKLRRTS